MKKSHIEKLKNDLTDVAKMEATYNEMLSEIRYLESAIPAKKNSIKESVANLHQSFTCNEIEEIIESQSRGTELSYDDWCDHSAPQAYYRCNSFDELKLRYFLQCFLRIKDYIEISADKAQSILQNKLSPFNSLALSTQRDLLKIGNAYNVKGSDELDKLVKKYCVSDMSAGEECPII